MNIFVRWFFMTLDVVYQDKNASIDLLLPLVMKPHPMPLWSAAKTSSIRSTKLCTISTQQMVASFFGITRHVTTLPLQQRKTINSEWYTTIGLSEVLSEIWRMCQNFELMGHSSYSSDFSPKCSFYFLSRINCFVNFSHRLNKPLMLPRRCLGSASIVTKFGLKACKNILIITENISESNTTIFTK